MVVADVDLSYFKLFYDTIDVGTAGRIALMRTDGTILTEKPYEAGTTGSHYVDDPEYQAHVASVDLNTFRAAGLDDTERLLTYHRSEDGRFVIAVALPMASVLADWRRDTQRNMEIAGTVGLVILLLGVALWRQYRRSEAATREAAAAAAATLEKKRHPDHHPAKPAGRHPRAGPRAAAGRLEQYRVRRAVDRPRRRADRPRPGTRDAARAGRARRPGPPPRSSG